MDDINKVKAIKHGNYATYSNHGCRCDECRTAHNEWHRQYRSSEVGKKRALLANRRSRRIQQESASYLKRVLPEAYSKIVAEVTIEFME